MTHARNRAERERIFDSGRCMAFRCRQVVKTGDRNKFLEKDGSISRLCPRYA